MLRSQCVHLHISNSHTVRIISQAGVTHEFSGGSLLPVWMRRRQHELEIDGAHPVLHLVMLDAVQLVGDVGSPHIHLMATL